MKKTIPTKPRPNVWVVTHGGSFAVRLEGQRSVAIPGLAQRFAVHIARKVAKKYGSELVVQGEHGQIRFRDSHGNDPCPPRG